MADIKIIDLPIPKIGSKIWLLQTAGIFSLERGPGVIRTNACTHAGAGSLTMYDGIPDDTGNFDDRLKLPDAELAEFVKDICRAEPKVSEDEATSRVLKSVFNGREVYTANPTVMGSWMLDGGFYFGFTIIASGGHEFTAPFASIVWMPRLKPAGRAKVVS